MPLHSTQQEHRPPASIVHRFCTMLQPSWSSQLQVTWKPLGQRSTLNVQRGTIIQLAAPGRPPRALVLLAIPATVVDQLRKGSDNPGPTVIVLRGLPMFTNRLSTEAVAVRIPQPPPAPATPAGFLMWPIAALPPLCAAQWLCQ